MDWKRIEGSILDRDVEISKSGDRFLRPCGNFTMFFAKDLEQFRSVQLTREWWRGSSNKSSISQWARTVSCWPFNVMAQWIMQKLIVYGWEMKECMFSLVTVICCTLVDASWSNPDTNAALSNYYRAFCFYRSREILWDLCHNFWNVIFLQIYNTLSLSLSNTNLSIYVHQSSVFRQANWSSLWDNNKIKF